MEWLAVFGPGAVIASLTTGAGELIFSSRGGALFGYRLLWFFSVVLLAKRGLVYAAAHHMVLTGAHPFERWMELPGPRGWFPLVLFLLALVYFPIWVSFHAGTVGTLVSWLADTEQSLRGTAYYLWGVFVLISVLAMVFTGGYARLERVQLIITLLMLLCVVLSLFLLKPDRVEFLKGLLIPQGLHYPLWVSAYPEIAFLLLGLKGYWDHSGRKSLMMLACTLAVGWLIARLMVKPEYRNSNLETRNKFQPNKKI